MYSCYTARYRTSSCFINVCLCIAATRHRIPKAERERLASMASMGSLASGAASAAAESSGSSSSPSSIAERGVAGDSLNASACVGAFPSDAVFEGIERGLAAASVSPHEQLSAHPHPHAVPLQMPPLTPIHQSPPVPLLPQHMLLPNFGQPAPDQPTYDYKPPFAMPSAQTDQFAMPATQTDQFAVPASQMDQFAVGSLPYDMNGVGVQPSFKAVSNGIPGHIPMPGPPAWAFSEAPVPADTMPPSRGSSSSSSTAAVLTPLFTQAQQYNREPTHITHDPKPLSPFRAGDSDSLYHRVSIYEALPNTPYDSVIVLESSPAARFTAAPLTSSISAAVALLPDDEFEIIANMCAVGAHLIVGPYSSNEASACPPAPSTLLDMFAYTGEPPASYI